MRRKRQANPFATNGVSLRKDESRPRRTQNCSPVCVSYEAAFFGAQPASAESKSALENAKDIIPHAARSNDRTVR